MRGAVAAGHELTAEAGRRVLAEGGNAVDACLAAAFASWVAESPLTGPGAGGFLLVHRARDRTTRLLDFFVAMPGLGRVPGPQPAMEAVDIDFDGGTVQRFLIGPASCAVPGTVAGLAAAHRTYGTLPWRELLVPAIELARSGVVLTRAQALLHALLDAILRHTPEGRAVYERGRARLVAGDRLVLPDLAGTLEALATEGSDTLYRGDLARAVVAHVEDSGGAITRRDLEQYRAVRRRPVEVAYRGCRFLSNPPPSSGGVLIGYGLALLDRLGPPGSAGSADEVAKLVEVMREQTRARDRRFAAGLYRGGMARRLQAESTLQDALARIAARLPGRAEPGSQAGTTHISALDAEGNAASLSASTGAGSGVVVPGTGIHLNNMLGEYDLRPQGRTVPAGTRLTSMMSPSLVLARGAPRLALGSAGSVRLRGAVLQVVANVVGHGLDVRTAVDAARVHLDEPHVHCEGGHHAETLDALEARGYDVVRWRRPNLFFGGVAAVERTDGGGLAAAGDPRRGGHGVVVP